MLETVKNVLSVPVVKYAVIGACCATIAIIATKALSVDDTENAIQQALDLANS